MIHLLSWQLCNKAILAYAQTSPVYFYSLFHHQYLGSENSVLALEKSALDLWGRMLRRPPVLFLNPEIKSIPPLNLKTVVISGGKEELRPNCSFQVFTETYRKLINVKTKC